MEACFALVGGFGMYTTRGETGSGSETRTGTALHEDSSGKKQILVCEVESNFQREL